MTVIRCWKEFLYEFGSYSIVAIVDTALMITRGMKLAF